MTGTEPVYRRDEAPARRLTGGLKAMSSQLCHGTCNCGRLSSDAELGDGLESAGLVVLGVDGGRGRRRRPE